MRADLHEGICLPSIFSLPTIFPFCIYKCVSLPFCLSASLYICVCLYVCPDFITNGKFCHFCGQGSVITRTIVKSDTQMQMHQWWTRSFILNKLQSTNVRKKSKFISKLLFNFFSFFFSFMSLFQFLRNFNMISIQLPLGFLLLVFCSASAPLPRNLRSAFAQLLLSFCSSFAQLLLSFCSSGFFLEFYFFWIQHIIW